MRRARKVEPRHRRAWWRLWRYCRCGHRWRCPDSAGLVPVPVPYRPPGPPHLLAAPTSQVELTETERAEIRALTPGIPPAPPPLPRIPATNQRPAWNAPTRSHLANGRAGALTPAQEHRARHGARG